ncbi:hypothetical protein MKX01_021269 [Papaver californicum]|nr:hypothetical protein MKX01_021269 [Papaver californicum]
MKYVLVTGGVVSGLGKGVTASSIGLLLKSCGLRVTSIKIDPYLNIDAGTMSPFEHGEVFVLDDGGEVDLDLGNYERFLDIKLTRDNNITNGKIHRAVIDKERKGDYLGKTVQVVPHVTDAIQDWIERVAMIPVDGQEGPADVCVIELGGTIGDIESMPFIEALGQFSYRVGSGNFCLVHVSLVPVLSVVGEQKTKPTQHSVRGLRGLGLTPNILAFVLLMLYISLTIMYTTYQALLHASVAFRKKLIVEWVAASDLELTTKEETRMAAWDLLKGADGILVPGGFGDRGVQGKILAAEYARENRIPFLGICLGMQTAVIEFARNVLNLQDANSTEFDPETANPCVVFMPEGSKTHMGGTMRLGSRTTHFQTTDCKSAKLYGNVTSVDERHRHRYEVNPAMIKQLESAGLSFVGKDETGERMEICELPQHAYYVGVQFHPEFKSRPGKPSGLFLGLIAAACGQLDTLIPNSGHANQPQSLKKKGTTITSNGSSMSNGSSGMKVHQNGNSIKAANGLLNGVYANGNGVHI